MTGGRFDNDNDQHDSIAWHIFHIANLEHLTVALEYRCTELSRIRELYSWSMLCDANNFKE